MPRMRIFTHTHTLYLQRFNTYEQEPADSEIDSTTVIEPPLKEFWFKIILPDDNQIY